MHFSWADGSSVSTTVDTLCNGTEAPILFSMQQMRNLEFELTHTAGELFTRSKFGPKNFPLSVSTSDHVLNVLDLAQASKHPSHSFAAITCPACTHEQTSYIRQELQLIHPLLLLPDTRSK